MPTYLPDGITFKNAGVWSKETETENPIIEMYFVNESGKEAIYMQQRLACEEAAFETGSMSEVEEVDINGAKGLAYDNAINWETEEVIYSLMSLDQNITRDEMLKVARSFNQVSK